MSKGSKPRPFDVKKFNDNFDRIFGEKDAIQKNTERPKQGKMEKSIRQSNDSRTSESLLR